MPPACPPPPPPHALLPSVRRLLCEVGLPARSSMRHMVCMTSYQFSSTGQLTLWQPFPVQRLMNLLMLLGCQLRLCLSHGVIQAHFICFFNFNLQFPTADTVGDMVLAVNQPNQKDFCFWSEETSNKAIFKSLLHLLCMAKWAAGCQHCRPAL